MLVVSWALRPLGFGTTNRREPSNGSGCSPIVAFGCPKAVRYAVIPAIATTIGRWVLHEVTELLAAGTQFSAAVNSDALAVARWTTLVIPMPRSINDATVGLGHADTAVDRLVDDPRLEQRRIEPVARMGEVGLGGGRPQPGVDTDEQQPQTRTDQVRHGRADERFEFGSGKPHLSDGRGLRHSGALGDDPRRRHPAGRRRGSTRVPRDLKNRAGVALSATTARHFRVQVSVATSSARGWRKSRRAS